MLRSGIYWLASYPKSGNTWFRIFLANLLNKESAPIDLNQINTGAIASSREWMDNALGFNSADLSHDELDQLRPNVYRWSADADEVQYHKIHDAYVNVNDHQPLVPAEGCLGAIYFVRNPLDVAISFANHSHCPIDKAIQNMGNPYFAFCRRNDRQHRQLRQPLLSWSQHVESWLNAKNIKVHMMRYEDMKLNPLATFSAAVNFLQITATPEKISEALALSHIDKLKQLETEKGFNEKPARVAKFFRKGVVDDWCDTLSPQQINTIIHDHGPMMRRLGYLDERNEPIIFTQTNVTRR